MPATSAVIGPRRIEFSFLEDTGGARTQGGGHLLAAIARGLGRQGARVGVQADRGCRVGWGASCTSAESPRV